jgi:hypothetical protein
MTVLLTVYLCEVPPKSPDHQAVHTSCISIQTHREAQSPTISEDVWNFVIRCSFCHSKHKTFDVLVSSLKIVFLELRLFVHRQGVLMPYHYCSLFPRIHDGLSNPHTSALFSHAWYLTSVWIELNCLPIETWLLCCSSRRSLFSAR